MPEVPPLKEPLFWDYTLKRVVLPQDWRSSRAQGIHEDSPGMRLLLSYKTEKGGWRKADVLALGGQWPLKRGWLRRLAREIDDGQQKAIEAEGQRLLFRDG